jgi:hypothetical protein
MTKFALLGTAALIVSLASPALANDATQRAGHTRMNTHAMHNHMAARTDARMGRERMNRGARVAYRTGNPDWNNNGWNNDGWDRHDSGFWPGEIAADAVGGAVATADAAVNKAGAIATAPFRNDSYAYYNDGYHNDWNNGWNNNWDRHDSGFWPGDVAADAVGGAVATADAAVGTAGAIATAPFQNDYAYNWDHRTYAQRNGFVCTPGTWFKGDDGRQHICQ